MTNNTRSLTKEKISEGQLSQESVKLLEILDQLDDFTSELRKKIMSDVKQAASNDDAQQSFAKK